MHDQLSTMTMIIHLIEGTLRARGVIGTAGTDDDRGAVSIEQVLWYAAAAVSVAVVAAIIWSQIRSTASTPVQQPSAP